MGFAEDEQVIIVGHHKPKPVQVRHIQEQGDGTFCKLSNIVELEEESFLPKVPQGWVRASAGESVMILKLSGNVEPHEDSWVENGPEPSERRALFWLLKSRHPCFFGTEESKPVSMMAGDWVFFDDRLQHWLMTSGQWLGCAWQLRRAS
jgi:hypothetical protein